MTYPVPANLLNHVHGRVTTLAVCWKLVRRDGLEILGTEHDRDITITTGVWQGTYEARTGITGSNVKSGSDLSADNMDVTGMTRQPGDVSLFSVDPSDIEAGLLDNADIGVFIVNWNAPDDGQRVLRVGNIGNITRTAEGQYRTEMRGLTQALSQTIVRTYSATCDAELGDARCGVNLANYTVNSFVDQTDSRRRFKVDGDAGDLATQPGTAIGEGKVAGGKITWTSGLNLGYSMEVKAYHDQANFWVLLYLPMPNDIQLEDTFTFTAGCGKTLADCQFYNNVVNFRGHGLFTPGRTEIFKIGGQ